MRIEVCNTNLSSDFMVALSMHPGLRSVHVSHCPCPCANLDDPDLLSYLSYCYHCMCWGKIFSNVPPALFGEAFSNIQEISLESAGLSVDQLNMFCAVIASQATTKNIWISSTTGFGRFNLCSWLRLSPSSGTCFCVELKNVQVILLHMESLSLMR